MNWTFTYFKLNSEKDLIITPKMFTQERGNLFNYMKRWSA